MFQLPLEITPVEHLVLNHLALGRVFHILWFSDPTSDLESVFSFLSQVALSFFITGLKVLFCLIL